MSRSRTVGMAGVVVSLALVSAAPCRAADERYCWSWRATSLGCAPFRTVGPNSPSGAGPGLRLERVDVGERGATSITSTGARFDLSWWPLICAQRLPVERDLLLLRSGIGTVRTVTQIDDFTCQVECGGAWLTFQGDSVVIIKPKLDTTVDLLVMFKPEYQAQQKGCVLAMDANGGFGVYPTEDGAFLGQTRPAFWGGFGMSFERDKAGRAHFARYGKASVGGKVLKGPEWQKDFGELSYHIKGGQELWISIFPPQQPLDAKAFAASVGEQDNPFEDGNFDKSKSSQEEYLTYRGKWIERANRFTPHPGRDIRRLVNVPAFFHNADLLKDTRNGLDIEGSLYRDGGTISVSQTNLMKGPLSVSLKWEAPGWQVSPQEIKLDPGPNAVSRATFTFGPSATGSAPRLLATYELPGTDGNVVSLTQFFAMPVNETTGVPRLAALGGLDALVEALKDQKPRVIRSDGDGFVRTRQAEANAPQGPKLHVMPAPGDSFAEIRLAVHARVSDPRCQPAAPQWQGSGFGMTAVDIYIGRPGKAEVRQFHFRALSPTGDKTIIFNENGRACGEADFPCRIIAVKPFGYEVHALIPLRDCLLEANTEQFLVDVALIVKNQFKLLYTGDPVRCAYRNSRYFAKAIVPEAP